MNSTLQLILRLAERAGTPVFSADDTRRWAPGTRDAMLDIGILQEIAPADVVYCDGCIEAHALRVDVREYPTGVVGVAMCPECGRVNVSPDRLQQWRFHFGGLANAVMTGLKATGQPGALVPERLWSIGTVPGEAEPRDLFIARGLDLPDAAEVVRRATALRRAPSPLVLTMASLPDPALWSGFRPAVDVLSSLCALDGDRLAVTLATALERAVVPHPDAKPEEWLSVTDAATKLIDVVDGLDIKRARARVSRAAGDNKFVTNGVTGVQRRIHIHSLSTWLMEQREKDLLTADLGATS